MAEVLNLALKKKIFEGLINKTSNEIPIKKNDWWAKRLKDQDTGRFKDFQVAVVSSGSSEKFYYEITKIELRGSFFIITVNLDRLEPEKYVDDTDIDTDSDFEEESQEENITPEVITPEVVNPEILEPTTINPVVYDKETNTAKTSPKKGIYSIKNLILAYFNQFCHSKNVYIVNMPTVTIRNNGQIFGCNRRLIADRDSDVKFDFIKKEFIQDASISDVMFLVQITVYLTNLLKNNYVFVNKNACGFRTSTNGELVFTIYAVGKKKYFFNR